MLLETLALPEAWQGLHYQPHNNNRIQNKNHYCTSCFQKAPEAPQTPETPQTPEAPETPQIPETPVIG